MDWSWHSALLTSSQRISLWTEGTLQKQCWLMGTLFFHLPIYLSIIYQSINHPNYLPIYLSVYWSTYWPISYLASTIPEKDKRWPWYKMNKLFNRCFIFVQFGTMLLTSLSYCCFSSCVANGRGWSCWLLLSPDKNDLVHQNWKVLFWGWSF